MSQLCTFDENENITLIWACLFTISINSLGAWSLQFCKVTWYRNLWTKGRVSFIIPALYRQTFMIAVLLHWWANYHEVNFCISSQCGCEFRNLLTFITGWTYTLLCSVGYTDIFCLYNCNLLSRNDDIMTQLSMCQRTWSLSWSELLTKG